MRHCCSLVPYVGRSSNRYTAAPRRMARMGSKRLLSATIGRLTLLTLVLACSSPEPAKPAAPAAAPAASAATEQPVALTPVRLVATFASGELGPIWLAMEIGAFARQGLAVDTITIMPPATA